MNLNRWPWLATSALCVVLALILFLEGYEGYAALSLAVGASAAVNLL